MEPSENKNSDSENPEEEEYVYQSAGIRERTGAVPLWLILVMVGLFVWGGYYLYRYWTPAG